ncbi:uncharacterized protein LOC100372657 isoform X1 [Saccoglossus kowalevskii]|uniref:Complement C1q tumor necrosis factor-related protein 4-like isoform X1 n=1 Tax=Saccoglossus kowalevskii TaxID=10224 RepID=A0ABM0GKW2_SACKO|nr:PREDICTED: complement C1q tumor necrosis factor-related protein 4-like isoform X1 [Saccoglossus kowalevskii]
MITAILVITFVGLVHGMAHGQRDAVDIIASLTRRIERLEAQYAVISNDNIKLRSLLDSQPSLKRRDVSHSVISGERNDVDDTSSDAGKNGNSDIRRRMNAMENKVDRCSRTNADIEKTMEELNNRITNELSLRANEARDTVMKANELIDEYINLTNQTGSKKCAFSGVRTSVLLGSAESQIITYDELYANKGKDFDIDTGIFTCQVPGIYYFSFTMRSYDNYHIGVTLVKNSSPQVSMITDASDRKVMQSQSVMLDLLIGDRVWLQLGPHKYFAVYSDDKKYITFNGFVLYPNYI